MPEVIAPKRRPPRSAPLLLKARAVTVVGVGPIG
jgi:hypothetical protein